ncbi:ribonuclease H-like domain-containing protein [Mycena belliarum]|uniref:ribonuclease H n=1 Tax=Mycena belliarum TaxID=1033014 RepID=A0AAD6XKN0_9AGAR|nr:ribonuclease H-like domain-containing protein [Mycena belliae]
MDYDSESEDQPRMITDVMGDFTFLGQSDTAKTFKLQDQTRAPVQTADGGWTPVQAILAVRPVPDPQTVIYAKSAMGNGDNGVWTGTRFEAPANTNPDFLFPARRVNNTSGLIRQRFCIRRRFVPAISHLKTMMIYTDGACSSNGLASPRAGFAFVFNPGPDGKGVGAVEQKGPSGQAYAHTSNRAELRAVIAALKFRAWWGEGWTRVVIVTDSEYVSEGATTRMRNWAGRGWRTTRGSLAANRDLWEALSDVLGGYAKSGCEISFWWVPRTSNCLADAAAKAAIELPGSEEFVDSVGILV